MDKVIIFDTTLRDGEQSAGAALTSDEKLEIARQLDKLGVDIIEAGFPISSKGELEAVRRIASQVRRPIFLRSTSHATTGVKTTDMPVMKPETAGEVVSSPCVCRI